MAESLNLLGSVRQARGTWSLPKSSMRRRFASGSGAWGRPTHWWRTCSTTSASWPEALASSRVRTRSPAGPGHPGGAALDPDHVDVAVSLKNLALVLHRRAAGYRRPCRCTGGLWTCRSGSLENDPEVGTTLNSLASALLAIGAYEEAEQAYRRALAIQRQLLGEEHRSTASTMNNLARAVSRVEARKRRSSWSKRLWESARGSWARITPRRDQPERWGKLLTELGRFEDPEPVSRARCGSTRKVQAMSIQGRP